MNRKHCQPASFVERFRCSPQRLTSRATPVKEFVRRFRLPFVMFFFIALVATLGEHGSAQTVSTVHTFNWTNGSSPAAGVLTQGRDGNLYGTTPQGGAYGLGTVFRQSSTGANNAVLHSFSGSDGARPSGSVTLARNNFYYGTTTEGGTYGLGVLFKINAAGVLTVLYNFSGGPDRGYPNSSPIEGIDGNLYGITGTDDISVFPTVYRMTSSGTFSTIYTFSLPSDPSGKLLQGSDGHLYATTPFGGPANEGTVTKMTTAGKQEWTYNFPYLYPGSVGPLAGLIEASDGNLYGTTEEQGTYGGGSVYKVDPTTGAVTTLYNFNGLFADIFPFDPLVQGSDGNLYGTTAGAGSHNSGIFELTLGGTYTHLYTFDQSFSNSAIGGLVQHTSGLFYGATANGGSHNDGTIYTLNMGFGPFIAFVRSQGHPGATAQILGQGLTGTSGVTFNGIPATSFKVVTDTYMTAVVPSGATTGKVVVTTPGGTLTSNVNFRILP